MSEERAPGVILGVGGGIAAYKSAELTRALMERGFGVQVVMTRAACQFVQPLTFAALTGRKVLTEMFPQGTAADTLSSAVEHIGVAQSHDVLAVAPATADLIAKFAHGLADDFLSTLYLAFRGPVVIAPAMNTAMWEHPATQTNLEVLRARGHVVVEPESGPLACGTVGPGRLASVEKIAGAIVAHCPSRRDLEGETVLITAGPTQEPLDPVRYITNRSSGKMGYALAEAAVSRGAKVILVTGPVRLDPPYGVELVPVRTALEMRDAVLGRLPESTIIIKSAAVADYHLAEVPQQKMKKTAMRLSLHLDPTPDILAEVGRMKGDRLLIGFAAETDHLREETRRKLTAKNCDMVVGNLVGEGAGFDADTNKVVLALRSGEMIDLPEAPKREIAHQILNHALRLRLLLHAAQ